MELEANLSFEILEVLGQPRPAHWARVWPTSIAMSRWLLGQAPGSLPTHATELGCGMGLVSVTLAHLGLVTRGTDREPLAIEHAALNAERNGVSGFSASLLEWSEPCEHTSPLVVASDVLYELGAPESLFSLLEEGGLLGRAGRLLLGAPQTRTMLTDELVARLRAHGYAHAHETRDVEWNGEQVAIDLHLLTRPA